MSDFHFGRRAWLQAFGLSAACPSAAWSAPAAEASAAQTQAELQREVTRPLVWPRDHGAHLQHRIEWWYLTGALWETEGGQGPTRKAQAPEVPGAPAQSLPDTPPDWGFQLTFFRARTPWADRAEQADAVRLSVPQLLFAHAALTDVRGQKLHHAQRTARWNGRSAAVDEPGAGPASGASSADTQVWIGDWQLQREASAYRAEWSDGSQGLALKLHLSIRQGLLLQGQDGWSAKSPPEASAGGPGAGAPLRHGVRDAAYTPYASRYYSQVQLGARGSVLAPGRRQSPGGRMPAQRASGGARDARAVIGVAWLDHEWSRSLLHPQAVGWDWVGLNLDDGTALTAFRLRGADGSVWWAGGSVRAPGQPVRSFAAHEVRMVPGRTWRSPTTGSLYPVEWILETPAGRHAVRSVLDPQELDSRRSTGTVYWEGLCGVHTLLDAREPRVGWGYLEMTGYAGRLKL